MMWSGDRFCGARDKASMSKIPEVDIPIYMYRTVSQRINPRRLHRHSRAELGLSGPGRAGQSGAVVFSTSSAAI